VLDDIVIQYRVCPGTVFIYYWIKGDYLWMGKV